MKAAPIEALVQRVANRLGLELRRFRPETSEHGRLASMLKANGINLVLDVGANVGQFAQGLRKASYEGLIVSFEPLAAAHEQLLLASRRDGLWQVAPRAAIGEREGELDIHVANNSVSSSALAMLDRHVEAAPESTYVASERVRLTTLDSMARAYLQPGVLPFLKIDTQGYEDRVLDGAIELMPEIRGLQLELSLVPLYEDQKLFDSLRDRITRMGFATWALWPSFVDVHNGRVLQVDAVFFRG